MRRSRHLLAGGLAIDALVVESAYPTIDEIGSIGCPVLVVAGTEDRQTTASETRRLFAAAREPKQLWLVEGAAHEDLFRFAPEAWQTTVLAFFDEHLERRPSRSPTGLSR